MPSSTRQSTDSAKIAAHAQIRYEQIKRKSFVSSSKLEGIELPEERLNQTLEEIVARYKAMSHG